MKFENFKPRLKLAWKILTSEDSNLVKHAERELKSSLMSDMDDPDYWMAENLIDVVRTFSTGQHSGSSAKFAINELQKLLDYKPLGPLTGIDSEWVVHDYDDNMSAQNSRCGRVFRRSDGTAYDIDAYVFREPNGDTFTGRFSRGNITFPYTPTTIYVDVPYEATEEQFKEAIRLATQKSE